MILELPVTTLPLLPRLRIRTQRHHEALARRLDILGPHLSIQDYAQVLQRFLGYHAPLERLLDEVPDIDAVCPDYSERKKSDLLEGDLRALDCSRSGLSSLPRCTCLPPVSNPYDVLGCLYAIESASLGGAVIAKYVEATLGDAAANCCGFFNGYGDGRGQMWRGLTDALSAVDVEEDRLRVVSAACATYLTLDYWLECTEPRVFPAGRPMRFTTPPAPSLAQR